MMIKIYIIFLIGLHSVCLAQIKPNNDSIGSNMITNRMQQLVRAKDDSSLITAYSNLGFAYERLNVDSSLYYYNTGLSLVNQKSYAWGEARLLASLSGLMEHQGKYAEAFELLFKSLKIAEENNLAYDIARANRRIGGIYAQLQNYPKAIAYILKALQSDEAGKYMDKVALDHYALADYYEKINKQDSAAFYVNLALKQKDLLTSDMQYVYAIDGHIKVKNKIYDEAATSYKKGFEAAQNNSDFVGSSELCADFAELYIKRNLRDSAIFYALKGFNYGNEISFKKGIMRNGYLLAELYDSVQPTVALKFYKLASTAKDTLFGVNNFQTIQDLVAREDARQKELEDAKTAYRNKLRLSGLLTGLAVLLIVAFLLYRNNRHKQKINKQLEQQKEALQNTLSELKSTQAQLIQSEKMASLGELTAGIAHEIQNPLNFVNNFSEVNQELLAELDEEIQKGNYDEVKSLVKNVVDNEEKIIFHGKRADAIVKGMLQHSRSSSGQKEPTDINALCDEYLRLAYHGLRAKDKSFNATMKTDFDPTVGNVNVIPQDMGRVILNLITNAFYAVNEKSSFANLSDKASAKLEASEDVKYEPTVWVSTKKEKTHVMISVKDNGNGIPEKVKEKIFQPFFTTKPTGQGTGLGLSMSYDIVTKGHGGTLKVESAEGKATTFTISLPEAKKI